MKFVILFAKFLVLIFSITKCDASIPSVASPVQLLNLSNGTKSDIVYNEEAVRNLFLDPKLEGRNVVVFSIVGAFRKGKSFLMNYILRYMYANYKSVSNSQLINHENWLGDENESLEGFDWKAGTKRVTSGLILWSDVFLYDSNDGEKLAIYLMDTQGLFDHKSSSTDNSRIFSLSTMISSTQILNLLNIIQENQLQYLQFATEYARYATADEEKSAFQNLLILIRDWNSPEEYKYGIRGGNAYLNNFLEIHDYQTKELQSVRRYLRSSFEKINCFLMAHPGKTVARDSSYNGSWSQIDEDFVHGMQDLFEFLFSPRKLTTKKVNGVAVEPAELLVFINSYVENFKSDEMPEATNIYESTLEKQFRILLGKSVDVYITSVASHNAELLSEEDVDALHVSAKSPAMEYFNSKKKFGSYSEGLNFKKELIKTIDKAYEQWKSISINHIRTLQQQRQKTNQKEKEVKEAETARFQAKSELEAATTKAEEAKKDLEQARYDTEEARRQAEELRLKSIEAEKERAVAIAKEKETREWLERMTKDKEFFEQQLNEYKANASQNVGSTLGNFQQENGFSRVLGNISRFFTAAAPFVSLLGGLFG
ncbi:CLUMA_CG000566, isoform A [Clunio marinus]|uniref:CLUMA_CG000566, isoform A n=1 Tax=Clunio marinus TaxID=568069 RepID=A0A1J1HFE3_9DIPT|nr:CLUMA_CG000566, isoform A [Clunio marinus]